MNQEPHIFIVSKRRVSKATKQLADEIFPVLQKSAKLGDAHLPEKRDQWAVIYDALKQVAKLGGYFSPPLGNRTGRFRGRTTRMVLEAGVDSGVIVQRKRSNPTNRRQYKLANRWK